MDQGTLLLSEQVAKRDNDDATSISVRTKTVLGALAVNVWAIQGIWTSVSDSVESFYLWSLSNLVILGALVLLKKSFKPNYRTTVTLHGMKNSLVLCLPVLVTDIFISGCILDTSKISTSNLGAGVLESLTLFGVFIWSFSKLFNLVHVYKTPDGPKEYKLYANISRDDGRVFEIAPIGEEVVHEQSVYAPEPTSLKEVSDQYRPILDCFKQDTKKSEDSEKLSSEQRYTEDDYTIFGDLESGLYYNSNPHLKEKLTAILDNYRPLDAAKLYRECQGHDMWYKNLSGTTVTVRDFVKFWAAIVLGHYEIAYRTVLNSTGRKDLVFNLRVLFRLTKTESKANKFLRANWDKFDGKEIDTLLKISTNTKKEKKQVKMSVKAQLSAASEFYRKAYPDIYK